MRSRRKGNIGRMNAVRMLLADVTDRTPARSGSLPSPPGPSGRRIRHLWARIRNFPGFLESLHARYGAIASYRLLSRQFCAVFDPDLIREILVAQRHSFAKTVAYRDIRPVRNPTLLTGDGTDHQRRRKLVQPSFGKKGMDEYAGLMLEKAREVQERWRDGHPLDAAREVHRIAIAVAVACFFGRDMRVDPKVGKAVVDAMTWDFALGILPCTNLLRRLPLPANLRARRAWKDMDDVIFEVIRRARDPSRERADLVSLLVTAEDEEGIERPFTDDEIRDEALILLMAGHETSAAAMTWCLYYVMRHPRVRDAIEREVDEIARDRPLTPEDYPKLPYTKAVFNEALRIAPPIYFVGREALEDCEIGGYRIRRGTVVQPCIRVVHWNERHFRRPSDFRPERWLEEPPGHPRHAFLPFGYGPRICIAWGFATMEAVLVMATIARRWRLEAVSSEPAEVDSKAVYACKGGLPAIPRRRRGGR